MSTANFSQKPTLVMGASTNPDRYSNMCIKKLRKNNYTTFAIGNKPGKVDDVSVQVGTPEMPVKIDTITIYLNARNQQTYYDYWLSLQPRRIIFNPGAENNQLFQLAMQHNIQPINACTLVMLGTGQF